MYFEKWEIVERPEPGESGNILLRNKKDHSKGTVVRLNYNAGQLQSIMPGDFSPGGGTWFSSISDAGISYVAGVYSYGYARRKYNEMEAEAAEERSWIEEHDRLLAEEIERDNRRRDIEIYGIAD